MKKVLVIGGGEYQCTLIRRLRDTGYAVYCVDKNETAPGFMLSTGYRVLDVLDKEACLKYAQELEIDGVMTYGATLTLPTVAYIGKKMGLPALSEETAEISKNKYQLKERLHAGGCNIFGEFFSMKNGIVPQREFPIPCVIKPCDGSGSKGVSLVYYREELEEAIDYAFSSARYGEIYCEELIAGEEYSVEAFVADGEIFVYGIVKTTFCQGENNDIRYGHRTPSGLPDETETLIAEEVKKAIRALNITIGSVNFDVILSEKTGLPYIIDCGIRIGQNLLASHLIPLSRGVSIIDNTIALALGEHPDCSPKSRNCVATRLLIYQPGTIREIKPTDSLIGTSGIAAIVLRKGVGDVLKPYRDKSDTCGWVVCRGDTPDEAEENAEKAKEQLREYILIEK